MIADTDIEQLTQKSMELLAIVGSYDAGADGTSFADRDDVLDLMEELAPNPHRAVGLACVIVKATVGILRIKLQEAGEYQDGDLLGLASIPDTRPSPAVWRCGQMLTAEWNGDHEDVADHAIAAAHAGDMEALMVRLLLQWHAIVHLEIPS